MRNVYDLVKGVKGVFKFKDIKENPNVKRIICHPNFPCPMNPNAQVECKICRLAIPLMSKEEVEKARKEGSSTIDDFAYTCPFKVTGMMALLEYRKAITPNKKKSKK